MQALQLPGPANLFTGWFSPGYVGNTLKVVNGKNTKFNTLNTLKVVNGKNTKFNTLSNTL
jgi:hypothetical protein